mgnify:CR=1 FL=1
MATSMPGAAKSSTGIIRRHGATFARLASENKNKQPIYDWALLNQAVAALLDQQDSIMHQALHEVENAGTNNFADPSLGCIPSR